MQSIPIQVLKREHKIILRRIVKTGSYACEIVCSLVEVSIIKVVLLLKYRNRHHYNHIDRQNIIRLDHCF